MLISLQGSKECHCRNKSQNTKIGGRWTSGFCSMTILNTSQLPSSMVEIMDKINVKLRNIIKFDVTRSI